jgi:DNA-binding CsgD family transcriptional regulator
MANPVRFTPDLRKAEAAIAANGGLFVDTETYSAGERDRLRFFAEIVRPQGISSLLIAQMSFRGQVCGLLVLMRHGCSLHFSPEDCRRLHSLLPAFSLAYAALKTGNGESHDHTAEAVSLTPRESEIAGLAHRGFTTPQIALALGTSANTVRKQLIHLYDKLSLAGRPELAAWFERHRDDVAAAQAEIEIFRVGNRD